MAKLPTKTSKTPPIPTKPDTRSEIRAQSWTGPLPPPQALEHFNHIIPGGAERILAMAEKEQAYRITSDGQALTAGIREGKRGQYLGATIAILAIVGAVLNIYLGGYWPVSCALVGVPILGVVQAIVRGRNAE
jgi:uncharacterized membrane protein